MARSWSAARVQDAIHDAKVFLPLAILVSIFSYQLVTAVERSGVVAVCAFVPQLIPLHEPQLYLALDPFDKVMYQ